MLLLRMWMVLYVLALLGGSAWGFVPHPRVLTRRVAAIEKRSVVSAPRAVVDAEMDSFSGSGGGSSSTYSGGSSQSGYTVGEYDDRSKDRTLSAGGMVSRLSDFITKSTPWGLYSMSLSMRPMYTKALSSMLGFLIGDFLAQAFYARRAFDVARFIRMGAFGALVHAPTGHLFYGFLERRFPGVDITALTTKLAIDQIAWTPVFGALLFSFVGVSAGRSPNAIFRTIKNSLLKVVLTSWMIWPVAHTVNFKYVTPKHRLLYINAVQVFYNVFLSVFSSGVPR